MIEFTAYLAAQQRTADLARQALPDAPVRVEDETDALGHRLSAALRHRTSLVLRRLADHVEPATPTASQSTQSSSA